MKTTFLYLFLFAGIFASCQSTKKNDLKIKSRKKENVDGGSCSYKHEKYPTVILWIDSSNVENCNLQLYRPIDYKDTIYYSMKEHGLLKLESIHAQNLKTGDTIIYQQSHMIEGSCNPFIERILLERFKKGGKGN